MSWYDLVCSHAGNSSSPHCLLLVRLMTGLGVCLTLLSVFWFIPTASSSSGSPAGLHHFFSSSPVFPSHKSGLHHSSSSSHFPAISLAFTILLLLLLLLQRSQIYLYGAPFFFFFCVPQLVSLGFTIPLLLLLPAFPSYISGFHHFG